MRRKSIILLAVALAFVLIFCLTACDKGDETEINNLEIIKAEGIIVSKDTLSANVLASQDKYMVFDNLEANPNATIKVYRDTQCTQEISLGVIDLAPGDNISYVLISSRTGTAKKVYTFIVHRNYIFDVTFNYNNGYPSDVEKVEEGNLISFRSPVSKAGYSFVEWQYEGSAWAFNITKVNGNMTLDAYWYPYQRINASGEPTENGNYILFGEYPQTIMANDLTITETTDSRGYYLGSDGYYYTEVTATPATNDYTFSTGATVSDGTVYYFKVEPIKWRILSESDGTALILCESIIANGRYDDSDNNYMNSEIRAWLNNEFYNTAFTALQQKLIQITNVDNSLESTGYSICHYVCDNTNDKIFLPSYREMVNNAFGFNSVYYARDSARQRVPSDYSRTTGAYIPAGDYDYGYWLLRSPGQGADNYTRFVADVGHVDIFFNVYEVASGIVPALVISLI